MNIACDARALVGPSTGVGTWTTNVAGGLAERGHQLLLASPRPVDLPPRLDRDGVAMLPRPRMPWPGTVWLHTVLRQQLIASEADVFVGSLAIVPRRGPVPSVAVVHDLTPRTHPSRHTLANRFCFNSYLESSVDDADAVVTVSRATADALLEVCPWARSKVVVIRNGVGDAFTPTSDDGTRVRQRFSDGRPYILHLGTIEPRKGIDRVVAAWERLQTLVGEPPDLVLAGAEGWGVRPILERLDASPLRHRVHRPGYVDSGDVPALLAHARVAVVASEAEGFGLPLAEAICCGAASVASDLPVLRETAGDAALYVDTADVDAFARTLADALDPAVADRLRSRAAARAPELRWGPVIDAWDDLLTRILRDR